MLEGDSNNAGSLQEKTRATLREMIARTLLTHRQFAKITGRAERTVGAHVNAGTIPRETADWVKRVREIHILDGRATIVVDLPGVAIWKDRTYLRADVTKIRIGARKKRPRKSGPGVL